MKTHFFTLCLFTFSSFLFGQRTEVKYPIDNKILKTSTAQPIISSEFTGVTFEKTECLTDIQRLELDQENNHNKEILLEQNPHLFSSLPAEPVLFIEPFRPKAGFSEYGYHTLQNQVDHNLTPNNNLLDYNCGSRTYDWSTGNHQGTDYILWPYPWLRMSENVMEIIAAADGVIINKRDGYADTNCDNNGNPNWNGFIIEHADGSRTHYLHFKKNTLNAKEIGDVVSAGEFLGIAGSSGSSTIPHLHFEVRKAGNVLVDPYAGECNSMNSESWWQIQEPYKVPSVNEISTHSVSTLDTDCPNIEDPYFKTNFSQGDMLYLRLFLRDISDGDSIRIKITKPDQSVLYDWTWVCDWGVFYATAYATWNLSVGSDWMDGIYKFEAEFDGKSYETLFGINTELSLEENNKAELEIFPNPVKDFLSIKYDKAIQKVDVLGLDGRIYKKINWKTTDSKINLSDLPKGAYMLRIWTKEEIINRKIIKN